MKPSKILKNIPPSGGEKPQARRVRVFKSTALGDGDTVTIVSEKGQVLKRSEAEVTPIVEDGVIVGVVHQCTCGKKSEIRFEFEE